MNSTIISLSGWIPAVIFPLACLLQLIKIQRNKSASGVSVAAWVGFGLANICLYIYTEKYDSYQTIIGMLGQSLIDFLIAILAFYYSKNNFTHSR